LFDKLNNIFVCFLRLFVVEVCYNIQYETRSTLKGDSIMYVHNPFGQPAEDFDRETAGFRVGRRIRTIRNEEGLSQRELGDKVGLNANRVQQYENGARKPKLELCKQFAEALDVETNALLDPQVANYIGAMYAFFEMETLYDLRLKDIDGQICICFGENHFDTRVITMNRNLKAWYDRRKAMEEQLRNAESEEEKKQIVYEYHMWEWNFPRSIEYRRTTPSSEQQ
jgi:transcriptional regulator with XRE-family HTH domain